MRPGCKMLQASKAKICSSAFTCLYLEPNLLERFPVTVRQDTGNLSFAFYRFPLPTGVALADDGIGGLVFALTTNVGREGGC